jgi:DNA helicase-2/ATP-dependent DNA helicase PcrA
MDALGCGTDVLPLAFHSFRGEVTEAAETLLLSHVTRQLFGYDGVYLRDALSTLKILDQKLLTQIQPELQQATESLKASDTFALQRASAQLAVAVNKVSTRVLNPRYWDVERLGRLARRLRFSGRLVPGLTAHQAKGREWDTVGVCLGGSERAALAQGLTVTSESHRAVYVACTRARRSTLLVD